MISLKFGIENSGTIRPLSGKAHSISVFEKIVSTSLSPVSGTICSEYHTINSSRSNIADSAKLTLIFRFTG